MKRAYGWRQETAAMAASASGVKSTFLSEALTVGTVGMVAGEEKAERPISFISARETVGEAVGKRAG